MRLCSSWQKSMYALKHRSASATSSSRASVSSRNRHSRTAFLPTRMSSTSNFLKPTWRSSTRWTNSSALLPYRMTCCNCGFTAKAAQKICFFPFQISVLLFLFLFISRIPSSLLQVQIQSPIASASSKSCVTRSIVFSFSFLRI